MPIPLAIVHENPLNRRRGYGNIEKLAASIRNYGLQIPIELAKCGCKKIPSRKHYRIIDGHRRFRALQTFREQLNDGEYRISEPSKREEVIKLVLTNIERMNYTPPEQWAAWELMKEYRALKQVAEKSGKSYGYVRNIASWMERVSPAIREALRLRIVTPCDNSSGNAVSKLGARELGQLARVSYPDQDALFGANLTLSQLRTAVKRIKEESKSAEQAIKEVHAGTIIESAHDVASATFTAGIILLVRGAVTHRMLCDGFGYSHSTAKRGLKKLEEDGFLYKGTLSPEFSKTVGVYMQSIPRSEISAGLGVARALAMGNWSREQVEGFIGRIRELTSPRPVASVSHDTG